MKVCTSCNVEKPLSDFYRRSTSPDGRRANCKTCHNRLVQPSVKRTIISGDWRVLAACIGRPELFYTDQHLKEAKAICAECPVSVHCRGARKQYERKYKQAHPGVWSGEYWTIRNNVKESSKARRSA